MFILGVINAWIPTYMSRYYGFAPDKAAVQAAVVVLVAGVGMIVCGWSVDRFALRDMRNRLKVPALYAVITCVLLVLGVRAATRTSAVRADPGRRVRRRGPFGRGAER